MKVMQEWLIGCREIEKSYNGINMRTLNTDYNEIAYYTYDTDSVEYQVTEYMGNIMNIRTKEDTVITDKQKIFNTIGYYADGKYYHYVKNHLGSICLVIESETDHVVQNTSYSASGVPSSTNLDEQPYLYNGKEFISAHGLNEYDCKARMYYPVIMRTTTMDPMAENYYHISPYAWCGNNPVAFVDPNGEAWKPTYTYDDNGNSTPNGYEWVENSKSYDENGNLLSGLYEQAIFFSDNGTYSSESTFNIGSSTATVYLADGSTQEFAACTYPSDINKYPTIPEGAYEAYVGMHHGRYLALKMRDIGAENQTIKLGYVNPAHKGRTYAEGVDIHKAGRGNFTAIGRDGRAVSEACFLIDINNWESFMSNFIGMPDGTKVGIQASRTLSQPINANCYPAYNHINNWFLKGYFNNIWR